MSRLRCVGVFRVGVAFWLLLCVGWGTGCQVNIVEPGKDPGSRPVPKEPVKVTPQATPTSKDWSFLGGEGAKTKIHYARVDQRDGSVYAAGSFRFIVHFGKWTLKSEGEEGSFLLKMSAEGALLWAKSFGPSVGGLALDHEGNPVAYFAGKLVKYDPKGTLLKQKEVKEVYRVAGLCVHQDGSVVLRMMLGGWKPSFGQSTLENNSRMEASVLGKFNAAWEPQWAFHIRSAYANSFMPHLSFAFGADGSVWLGGVADSVHNETSGHGAKSFPAFIQKVPSFKGGAFLAKLSADGSLATVLTGDATLRGSVTPHQEIRHLSVDQAGRVWALGVSTSDGKFADAEIPKGRLFRILLDATRGPLKVAMVPLAIPDGRLLHSFALDPKGDRVFVWGGVSKENFSLPSGAKVSPDSPAFSGVWSIAEGKLRWSKETTSTLTHLLFAQVKGSLLLLGDLPHNEPREVLLMGGGNVFVEQRSLARVAEWSVKSEGRAAFYPLWIKSLRDGGLVALVELNGRVYNQQRTGQATRKLLRFGSKGKITALEATPEMLFSSEVLPYLQTTEVDQVIPLSSGSLTLPRHHLHVFHPAQQPGDKGTLTKIPAKNVQIDRVLIRDDGKVVVSGFWKTGRGLLGTREGSGSADRLVQRMFLALFSQEGKELWYKEFDIDSVVPQVADIHVTKKGTVYLLSGFYMTQKKERFVFGDKSIPLEDSFRGPGRYMAVLGAEGEVLSLMNLKDLPCSLTRSHALPVGAGDLLLSGTCMSSGTKGTKGKVLRIEQTGKVVWSLDLESTGSLTYAATLTRAEDIHVVGSFSGSLQTKGREVSAKGEGADAFVVTISQGGELSYLSAFGSEGDDQVLGATTVGEKLFVTGATRASLQLGASKVTGNGGFSMFVVQASLEDVQAP